MNSTRAAQTMIQALWPGPGPATLDSLATRAPLFMYASMSPMRSSSDGPAAAAGAAASAGAATAAGAAAGASSAQLTLAGRSARMNRRRESNRLDILGTSERTDEPLGVDGV